MKNIDTVPRKSAISGYLAATIWMASLASGPAIHAQCGYTLTGVITQPTCGMNDGIIQLLIGEGVDVYSIDWSSGEQGSLLTDQAAGYYSVTVLDWNGCATTADFILECDDGSVEGEGGEVPIDDDCSLTTFTQGGWGSQPRGGNPGAYLHGNFSGAFPNGITIGCNNQLRLSTAQAVTNYLPGGGQPAMLPNGVLMDPAKYKNVLAAQLVAATLNVGMDAYDAGMAPSTNLLGNAVITSGPFAGNTVHQLLDMANSFIGGCGGSYSASQYNDALSQINENFVDGTTDNGFLSCGGVRTKSLMINHPVVATVFPNPAASNLMVRLQLGKGVLAKAQLLDLTGRVISTRNISPAESGVTEFRLDVSGLVEGVYFIRISSGSQESTTRVVVAH